PRDGMRKIFARRQWPTRNASGRQETPTAASAGGTAMPMCLQNMAELPIIQPRGTQQPSADGVAPLHAPDRIIRLQTVLTRTGLSRSTLYRKIAEGTFPPQVRISVHGAGWHESAVNRWIADPPGYR